MKFNRNSYISTKRDAWVEINLANLENNVMHLNDLFVPPQSSNTQAGSGESSEVGQGRPEISNPADLTDEGDASRSKG